MNNYLTHHGIKGQKWGVRRFQNINGSLTPAGQKRYLTDDDQAKKERNKKIAIGVGVGVGVAAAIAGTTIFAKKYKNLKNDRNNIAKELGVFKEKEARTLANLAAGRAKRLADKANGVVTPKKIKIKPGSKVVVDNVTKTGTIFTKTFLDVAGGHLKVKGGK